MDYKLYKEGQEFAAKLIKAEGLRYAQGVWYMANITTSMFVGEFAQGFKDMVETYVWIGRKEC